MHLYFSVEYLTNVKKFEEEKTQQGKVNPILLYSIGFIQKLIM